MKPEEGADVQETSQDLLPEHCRYRDEGCELFASCLRCPLPQCIYEYPRGRQRLVKGLRDREICRRRVSGGCGVKELASAFGISVRTVQRALKHCPPAPDTGGSGGNGSGGGGGEKTGKGA